MQPQTVAGSGSFFASLASAGCVSAGASAAIKLAPHLLQAAVFYGFTSPHPLHFSVDMEIGFLVGGERTAVRGGLSATGKRLYRTRRKLAQKGSVMVLRNKDPRREPEGSEAEQEFLLITNRKIVQASEAFDKADEAEEFQAVGMRCRECLLTLIRELTNEGNIVSEPDLPKTGDFIAWND